MAELQTVAAVLDLLKVAYQVGVFLKKVADAEKIAVDLSERIERLSNVLEGVQAVLKHRIKHGAQDSGSDANVAARICDTAGSCSRILNDLETRLPDITTSSQNATRQLLDRVRVALRQPSINRISTELEARIQILSTDLAVLQLFDQANTRVDITANHHEVLGALSTLGVQVSRGNELLHELMRTHPNFSDLSRRRASEIPPDQPIQDVSQDAIDSLTECLRSAGEVHERYTSSYDPDTRSVRFHRGLEVDSPLPISTPSIRRGSEPSAGLNVVPLQEALQNVMDSHSEGQDEDEDEDVEPLEILDRYISGYVDRAMKEKDQEHFNQAEKNLDQAIRYSISREMYYGVAFDRRAEMEEDLAFLYQKQKKFAEAVQKVSALLRDRTGSTGGGGDPEEQTSLAQARQNQLLASIYFDRHTSNIGFALNNTADDVEKAELHAKRAFHKQYRLFGSREKSAEEAEQHDSCLQLLVRILEARDKTVEANELKKLSVEGSSISSDSIRRISTTHTRQGDDCSILVDKHEILIEAIKCGDTDQIESLLGAEDLDLAKPCKQGKTLLMHAVENADEATVHKLLDPEIGVDVNSTGRRGLTALHFAAMNGHHDMAHCLLRHDAVADLRDRDYHTPMIKAVQAGDEKMVQVFYDEDESTLDVKGGDEWSLLHYSIWKAGPEMTSFLLGLNSDLKDAVDLVGKTALHHAADLAKIDHCQVLLEHRADANAVDGISRTPLYFAASKPHAAHREDVVRLLVKHGADVEKGKAPLRARDYLALKRVPRRDSAMSRTSVSTSGTIGTTSTDASRFSKLVGRFGRH